MSLNRFLFNAVRVARTTQMTSIRAFSTERFTGTVKWFDDKKGFGFVQSDDMQSDVFVHHSEIKADGGYRTLQDGQEVEFEVINTPDGKTRGANVTGPDGAVIVAPPRQSNKNFDEDSFY